MSCSRLEKVCIPITIILGFIYVVFLVPSAHSQDQTQQRNDEKTEQKMLEREAANALKRLKRSMKKDGFYSGRVALNIWRSTAEDAGTFDQVKYEEYKKQLYEKSVNDSMSCFQEFLLEDDFFNANFCLQTWRMHAKELGTYEEEDYEALKQKIAEAKAAKASRKAEKK